jgi:hypothetical protein
MDGKAIPMTNEIIRTINDQGSHEEQPDELIFGNMNNLTTILDLEPCKNGEEKNTEFDDDNASDGSYEPKDDNSELSDDHDIAQVQYEEDVLEVGAEVANDADPGVDEEIEERNDVNPPDMFNKIKQDEDEDAMLEDLHEEDDPLPEDLNEVDNTEDNDINNEPVEEPIDEAPRKKEEWT